jgi:SAM-dependent methyltransferase
MKRPLLKILCCPICRSGFALVREGLIESDVEVRDGTLRCKNAHTFPVKEFIPRFVESDLYVGNFSFEWTHHATTQMDSDRSLYSQQMFHQLTYWKEPQLKGKLVLDVGCGTGRYVDVAEKMGAIVVGVDLSFAVDSAQKNLGSRNNVHLVQADIFHLPFRTKSFDVIYSLGVLHHTPDTKKAFSVLPDLLKPGGTIAVWVYARYFGQRWHDIIRTKFTSRLPKRLLHYLCMALTPLYLLYKIPVLRSFLQLIFWYPADGEFYRHWRWRWLDLFDFYSPTYAHRHSYPEVWKWFEEARLVDIRLMETPVALSGSKR